MVQILIAATVNLVQNGQICITVNIMQLRIKVRWAIQKIKGIPFSASRPRIAIFIRFVDLRGLVVTCTLLTSYIVGITNTDHDNEFHF